MTEKLGVATPQAMTEEEAEHVRPGFKTRLGQAMSREIIDRRWAMAEARRRVPLLIMSTSEDNALFTKRIAQAIYEHDHRLTEIPTVWTNQWH